VLLWTPLDVLLHLPLLGMLVVGSNTCGAYISGVSQVSSARLAAAPGLTEPLKCSLVDLMAIACVLVFFAVKAYVFWALLILWHSYQFGWTTTDLRALPQLSPFSFSFVAEWRPFAEIV